MPVQYLPEVIQSGEPLEEEPIVPTTGAPTTLMQWAVLILNTADPMLKVRKHIFDRQTTSYSAYRLSAPGTLHICFSLENSHRWEINPQALPNPLILRQETRRFQEI